VTCKCQESASAAAAVVVAIVVVCHMQIIGRRCCFNKNKRSHRASTKNDSDSNGKIVKLLLIMIII